MLKNLIFRWVTRLFLPDLAKQMEREGTLAVDGAAEQAPPYVQVEDHGGDVTLFCFSGMAVLFAGLPSFEFRKLLSKHALKYNLVFFRDIHRLGYQATPDGQPGGVAFYEAKARELMDQLGARYNVALGSSGGGSASIYFGTACQMDQVIAFSPVLTSDAWPVFRTQWRAYLDLPKLFTRPSEYLEVALVALSSLYVTRKIHKFAGDNVWQVLDTFRNPPGKRPQTTIFYGERCYPDAQQRLLLEDLPEVQHIAVPTGRHNCPGYLKAQGTLGDTILDLIAKGSQAS